MRKYSRTILDLALSAALAAAVLLNADLLGLASTADANMNGPDPECSEPHPE